MIIITKIYLSLVRKATQSRGNIVHCSATTTFAMLVFHSNSCSLGLLFILKVSWIASSVPSIIYICYNTACERLSSVSFWPKKSYKKHLKENSPLLYEVVWKPNTINKLYEIPWPDFYHVYSIFIFFNNFTLLEATLFQRCIKDS